MEQLYHIIRVAKKENEHFSEGSVHACLEVDLKKVHMIMNCDPKDWNVIVYKYPQMITVTKSEIIITT
jgi:hypothetical protein